VTTVWFLAGMAALVFATSCRRGLPGVTASAQATAAHATINGTVRGAEGGLPVSGRTVSILDMKSGERRSVQTTATGTFTIELPAGEYRLDVDVRDGETVLKHPNIVALDAGDVDSHVEFVVASARLARPRGPAYRVDNGLGSPVV
jgi:Carboxypeptidase regulatory-like domain